MGKFPDQTAETLYELSLDGSYPDSGDVEAPTGWFCLVIHDGNHVLYQDSQGFVDYDTYPTEKAAKARFDALDREYAKWATGD